MTAYVLVDVILAHLNVGLLRECTHVLDYIC